MAPDALTKSPQKSCRNGNLWHTPISHHPNLTAHRLDSLDISHSEKVELDGLTNSGYYIVSHMMFSKTKHPMAGNNGIFKPIKFRKSWQWMLSKHPVTTQWWCREVGIWWKTTWCCQPLKIHKDENDDCARSQRICLKMLICKTH